MELQHALQKEGNRSFSYKYNMHIPVDMQTVNGNIVTIKAEMDWLGSIFKARLEYLKDKKKPSVYFHEMKPPVLGDNDSPYASLVKAFDLNPSERLLLISCLVPHIAPAFFTRDLKREDSFDMDFPELGGYIDSTFHNFVPTFQTILYLLGGDEMDNGVYHQMGFIEEGKLLKEQIVTLSPVKVSENDSSMRHHVPELAPEYVYYLVSGKKPMPDFGRAFPASLIATNMDWEQLVVPEYVRREIERILRWAKQGKEMVNYTKNVISPSFPCLFHGPSGTGKTLAAQLIGKTLGKDVFRIDLSMIVSKYIGETEKNLAFLFDRAEGKDWILFFDEADALFGKRTSIGDAKDKWANLEMSYLLQRMEEYTGLTILATNIKNNIDNAMSRRFQAVVHFPRPDKEERIQLWKKLLPEGFSYAANVSYDKLGKYEITGGNIINAIKSCCLEAYDRKDYTITGQDLYAAVVRELGKESRTP